MILPAVPAEFRPRPDTIAVVQVIVHRQNRAVVLHVEPDSGPFPHHIVEHSPAVAGSVVRQGEEGAGLRPRLASAYRSPRDSARWYSMANCGRTPA